MQMAENGPVDAGAAPALDGPTDGEPRRARRQPAGHEGPDPRRPGRRSRRPGHEQGVVSDRVGFLQSAVRHPVRPVPAVTELAAGLRRDRSRSSTRTVGARRALRIVALDRERVAQTTVEIQARSEIRIAQEAVRSFERALTSARLAAQQAAEVLKISTAAFEVGATTNIEVIDAQRSSLDADTAADAHRGRLAACPTRSSCRGRKISAIAAADLRVKCVSNFAQPDPPPAGETL